MEPKIEVKIKTKTGEYVVVPATLDAAGELKIDIASVKHLL